MKNQVYYSVHANLDQVQVSEVDTELYELFGRLQVNKNNKLLGRLSESFMGLSGNMSRLFYGFKYNEYTNLSRMEAGRRVFVHGEKGIHDLKRSTPFIDFYVTEEKNLEGPNFFRYVFGTNYPTEQELRTQKTEEIKETLSEAAESPQAYQDDICIKESDREMVCRIAAKLWEAQLENSTSRLVILLPKENIYEESVDLLKQLYLLLPQRLRMNMGFAVDVTHRDIKHLTETCDLPIHVMTMRKETKAEYDASAGEVALVYPVVYVDAATVASEEVDPDKYQLLVNLSKKLSSSSDAKMAYVEKRVIADSKRFVSFKNLDDIFSIMSNEDFFWWDRHDLETVESVIEVFKEQRELMSDPDLRNEALTAFYTKMLPQKNYALALNEVLLSDSYKDREAILKFFSEELLYGGILKATQAATDHLHATLKAEEEAAVLDQKEQDAIALGKCQDDLKAEQTSHAATINQARATVERMRSESKQTIEGMVSECSATCSHINSEATKQVESINASAESVITGLNEQLNSEREEMLREADEKREKLIQEHRISLEDAKNSIQAQMDDLKAQYQSEKERATQVIKSEREELESQQRAEINQLKQDQEDEIKVLEAELNRYKRPDAESELKALQDESETLKKKSKESSRKVADLKEKSGKRKVLSIVLAGAAGLLLITTVVFAVLAGKKSHQAAEYEQILLENSQVQAALEQAQSDATEAQTSVDAQIADLQKQKEELQAELDDLKAKAEAEKTEEVSVASETDAETDEEADEAEETVHSVDSSVEE